MKTGGGILVVDDNPTNLRLMLALLASGDYEIRTAMDAAQAFAALETFLPRLILLDLQLPDIDGLELTRRLKRSERTRNIPVVAVTAYAMAGDEQKARTAGVEAYVTKPVDKASFREIVSKYMNQDVG